MKFRSFNPSQRKFVIFSMIGVFNTLFDVALYVVLYNYTHSIIVSNIITTSAALVGSYALNSRFTFKKRKWTLASFSGFVAITLFGLWVLQTGLIYIITHLLQHATPTLGNYLGAGRGIIEPVIPKLIATACTFMWNFVWYNKVIFRSNSSKEQIVMALDE